MVYSLIVKKEIRRSFDHVNNQRWDDAAKGLTPNAYHWVAGDHALGGERHGKQSVKQWFERMGRVFPKLHIDIEQVEVTGWHGIPQCSSSGGPTRGYLTAKARM